MSEIIIFYKNSLYNLYKVWYYNYAKECKKNNYLALHLLICFDRLAQRRCFYETMEKNVVHNAFRHYDFFNDDYLR